MAIWAAHTKKAGLFACVLCLLAPLGALGQEPLRSFSPNPGAEGVPGQTSLRWSVPGANLVVNGSFEDRSLAGWDVPLDANAERNIKAYEGTNVLRVSGGVVAQEITLPQTTSPIMWTFGMTGPLGRFTAQVQSPGGVVLKSEDFFTQGRSPLFGEPWRGAVDISEFAGQTVRLVFDFPRTSSTSYSLDDVRVEVFPEGIEFDVYGLDPQLQWLGRTRDGTWPVPELGRNSSYTWRVDAILNGTTNTGPQLTFKTKASSWPWEVEFARVPPVVCPDQPLLLEMIVRDTNHFALSPAGLETLVVADNAPPPPIVISELNVSTNAEIEFANVSDAIVDLSRWKVEMAVSFGNTRTIELPPGAKLGPGEVFTMRQNETDGVWPRLTLFGVNWSATNASASVVLRDTTFHLVDCVFVDRRATNTPGWGAAAWSMAWPIDWRGPVLGDVEGGLTYQRIGDSDENDSGTWTAAARNIGFFNPELSRPFRPGYGRVPVKFQFVAWPPSIPASHTSVILPAGLSNAFFYARAPFYTASEGGPSYAWGQSALFQVPDARQCMTLVGEFAENDGRAPLRIALGAPATQDVVVKLSLTAMAPFFRPENYPQLAEQEVTVRAGESEAVAHLDITDNASLEGPRTFRVRATADGYGDTWTDFTLRDDERPQLTLTAPAIVREGEPVALILESSIIPVSLMNLTVRTEPPSGVASSVTLSSETNRTEIWLGGYDDILQGDGKMKLIVEHLDWTPATVEFDYVDATQGSLSLELPVGKRIVEGGSAQLSYSMGAIPLTTRSGTLRSSRPQLVPVPEQVSFEAGSGSGIIFLTALPAAGPDRVETVELILSAEGLESVTNVLEIVIEGEDSGQIVSTGFAADGQTLEIEFNSRADWKYVLGRATNVSGPWRLDMANALIGTGAVMKFLVGRTWYPGPEPSFYRVFREP